MYVSRIVQEFSIFVSKIIERFECFSNRSIIFDICIEIYRTFAVRLLLLQFKYTNVISLCAFYQYRNFATKLKELLNERFPKGGSAIPQFAAATVLHPTYKHFILSDLGTTDETLAWLKEHFDAPAVSGSESAGSSTTGDNDEESEPEFETAEAMAKRMQKSLRKKTGADYDIDPTQMYAPSQIQGTLSPIQLEVNSYMAMDLPRGQDVLQFWSNHEKTYPLLAKAARHLLCIQPTSCSSERAFSTGGQTVSVRRTKLDPENVHMLVYCKENLPKVHIRKWKNEDVEEEAEEHEVHQSMEMAEADSQAQSQSGTESASGTQTH